MSDDAVTQKIGRYELKELIARGGMGEVHLAYDPVCDRQVALKRIRSDLKNHDVLRSRFLKEAKLTAGLTHPGIISIFSLEEDFYTMPYVEGKTLKQMLRESPSIPALLPIFRSLCETVAYTHSRGILHRDLKPENILVGTFGEVIILDWGLAQLISEKEEIGIDIEESGEFTHPGKIVGSLAFMSPERALGESATVSSDLYALGVILYQILTLQLPFRRKTLKEYRKAHAEESLHDPQELAPYRDVPPALSRIVRRCLERDPKRRYPTVDVLLHDLKAHLEGRSEWFEAGRLSLDRKRDWAFHEHVMISKHIAITRSTEAADWVSVMLSKAPFAQKCRLHTRVRLGSQGHGIGFLLCVPEAAERESPLEGYCLWIGSEEDPFTQLFRNTVEVLHVPDLCLKRGEWHDIVIERIDNNIYCSVDGVRRLTYLSFLPIVGTHVGLLTRDANFDMEEIRVSVGSQDLQVSCLAIPDAFLASKDYKRALAEYRRIGYSFPGYAEGREALFRGGITLLEQARSSRSEQKSKSTFSLALDEFAQLHNTPGAPLEYLGKALVYQALRDHEEEIKCLELALRRYQSHPLVGVIKEQILYRMHESAQTDRRSTYQLILIVLRHLPEVVTAADTRRLFKHLVTHWETLPFFEGVIEPAAIGAEEPMRIQFAITLAFWLAAPYMLLEMLPEAKQHDAFVADNLIYALYELGSHGLAETLLKEPRGFEPLILCHRKGIGPAIDALSFDEIDTRAFRNLYYLCQYALRTDQEERVHEIAAHLEEIPLSREERIMIDGMRIWAHLKEENWFEAERIFETYPLELLNQESTILHPLFGCYLRATEGEEIALIHFAGVLDTPFPRSWALLGHELTNKITESPAWYNTSFMWERRQLYRGLTLYYQCAEDPDLEHYYRSREREEYIYVTEPSA